MKSINCENALDKTKELLGILLTDTSSIDFSECIGKLQEVIASSNDPEVKIVLLGSFSDGKTSTIAGLMGQVLENMKIDSDESSDELIVYRPLGLKKGFVIVDTPGLFGTKEREVDGESVHFSDITNKYISEAHIILYVTSAVAPIKDSHSKILKRVLRDMHKLDSTIFVLNKMDETGVNITNDDAYERMSEIKKEFVTQRLSGIISLTKEEASKLNVVCISADPKRKGVENWLITPDKYNKLSRIPNLNSSLTKIVSQSNIDQLRKEAYLASLEDVIRTFVFIYNKYSKPLRSSLFNFAEDFSELEINLNAIKSSLLETKSEVYLQLDSYRKLILQKIQQSSYEEMSGILLNDLGVENDNVTFYVIQSKVDSILNQCSLSNSSSLNCTWTEMKTRFEKQDGIFRDMAGKGIDAMKGVNNKAVLAARDLLFKGYKFKPWGAVKFANGIGKAAAGLQAILFAFDIYGRYKRNKELQETKKTLTDIVSTYFSELFKLISTDWAYFENFAPSYIEMNKLLEERRVQYDELNVKLNNMQELESKVSKFYGQNIIDIDFEEL